MMKRILGGALLLAGQAWTQTSGSQQSIFQSHRYMVDWEDWPSYFIENPSVAVCYHKQDTNFLDCADTCADKTGKPPRPINSDCDMIATDALFENFPRFTWTAFTNHTTINASYQFVFVLLSEDRSQREIFTAGNFAIRAFDVQAAPKDDPTEFLIQAQAADVPTPSNTPSSDSGNDAGSPTATGAPASPSSSGDSGGTPAGVIIGGVLGGVAGGAILTLAAFVILRRRQAQSSAAAASNGGADVEAARSTGSPEPTKLPMSEKTDEIAVQEVEGSVAGTELVAPIPVAELEGDQAIELAGTRMSQIGMATSTPENIQTGTISTMDSFRMHSPTLGSSSNHEVSPLESTAGKGKL